MLIEFSVENYRSIRDKAVLSMVATRDRSLSDNLIHPFGEPLLNSAAIYGPNASGKTNLLMALAFLQRFVLTSHLMQLGQPMPFSPFKLDSAYLNKPTMMKVVFLQDGIRYCYGVSFNRETVIEEYLYHYPNNKKSIIFERHDNNYRFVSDENVQVEYSKRTLSNMLYLSKSTQENYPAVRQAFEWFKSLISRIGSAEFGDSYKATLKLLKDRVSKSLILGALAKADLGIDDVSVNTINIEPANLTLIKSILRDEFFKQETLVGEQIRTMHKGIEFDLWTEESAGTKRLFSLLGPFIDAIVNGKVLLVDELELQLHPLLQIFLLELFRDPTQNKKNAQLIFTTHNVNLIDQGLFRRDQIWITEKDNSLSTVLYSITDFSPRKDKKLLSGYLSGKYGGLPRIKGSGIL